MFKLELEKKDDSVYEKKHIFISFIFLIFIIFPVIVFSAYTFLVLPPNNFPLGKIIEIKKGESSKQIAEKLKKENIINSDKLFLLGIYKFNKTSLKAGKYIFKDKLDVWEVYKKIASGDVVSDYIKFTIFEGEPNYLIAKTLSRQMKNIEEDDFFVESKKYEGKLYPDTYHLPINADVKTVLKIFLSNFDKKMMDNNIKYPVADVILIKASLVESEAGRASYNDKRHVASVIENRLKRGMKLQIDAVFSYIYKRHLKRVLHKHLKIDSKYNLYKYAGLPPTPISNPSINSIKAVLDPMDTRDLYYITGNDGVFYYSRTGSGHNRNVNKYLR